jgi:hypothetical protein
MSIIPIEWNVVVIGYWNRAILTPSGIATKLFGLDAGTPVSVLIAIDTLAPHLVKHHGITVIAGSDRLTVQPDKCEFQELQKAKEIADRALEKLPETPVVAAGINVKYACREPVEALQRLTQHEWWDKQLSDSQYEIVGRSLSRSLKWKEGQINLSVTEEADGATEILFNFHRAGGVALELMSWLSTSIIEIESEVKRLLFDCMQLNAESIEDATVLAEV